MSSSNAGTLTWVLLRLAKLLLVAYVAIAILAYIFQRRLLYFPDLGERLPVGNELPPGLEEATIKTADGVRLHAWYWPGERPVTLVIFHGNGSHRGNRLGWITLLHDTLGVGVFILDYRGYGGSGGSPTEKGLYLDAEAAWKWLADRAAGKLVYYGESLGGAVAVELARHRAPAALILQSAFSSAVDVARKAYPFLPVNLLMKDRYENLKKISEVHCPTLVIHGEADNIVPPALGRALFEAANEPKEWYPVADAGHNDLPWRGGKEYLRRLEAFLERLSE